MKTVHNSMLVNHAMISLARESRGLTQGELAGMLGVSQGFLSKIENGALQLSEEGLRTLSRALNYPAGFFFRNDRVYGVGLGEFFHRKRQSVPKRTLSKVYAKLEVRRMEIATLLKSADIGETNFFAVDPDEYDRDIEMIAQAVRAAWKVPHGPIDNVVNLIERAGGIVVPFDFETAQIDAISNWYPGLPPLFFVNFRRPMDRIRFTLCHEIGHLIMHKAPTKSPVDLEREADRFAAEFLMPGEEIGRSLINLNLQKLAALKPHWKVSMGALIQRAADLNRITDRHARYLWMQMGKLGYRTREPAELDLPYEHPQLLDEIVRLHQKELGYGFKELCSALCLAEEEFRMLYLSKSACLRVVSNPRLPKRNPGGKKGFVLPQPTKDENH